MKKKKTIIGTINDGDLDLDVGDYSFVFWTMSVAKWMGMG